jgi:hypothetical protein
MNEQDLERLLNDALAEPGPPDHVLARARKLMPSTAGATLATWIERARTILAEIRIDTRAQPALAGFRNAATHFQLLATSGPAEVFIQVVPMPGSGAPLCLRGQLDSPAAEQSDRPVAAVSQADGTVVALARSGHDGSFELRLRPGCYDLAIGLDPPFLVPGLDLA